MLSNYTTIYDGLQNLDVDYVVFGICEDIGVFANYGKSGTSKAWMATLKVLLNIQSNQYTNANRVCILGHLDYETELTELESLNQKKKKDILRARQLTEIVDKDVSYLVSSIIKAGKIPIIIGGGHNNAYGNIKGCSLGLNTPINAINFDAHTDFRKEEGRHSGNGFTYAFTEGFLNKYYIFGLHENYTSQSIFDKIHKLKQIGYCSYESIEVRKEKSFKKALQEAQGFISNKPFGIEIDCDAIENMPSSAQTPSGFSVRRARQFLHHFASNEHVSYLHICEALPKKKQEPQVGKLITYLITDFIKANGS